MRKTILALVVLATISLSAQAQRGSNRFMLGADINIPTGDFGEAFNLGAGVMGKFLFGVTPAGQVTATTGITFFGIKKDFIPAGASYTYRIIPILLGYRHNFNGLFLEPQLGVAIYGATAKYQGMSESTSDNAFTWAAGIGYLFTNNLEMGLRYQSGEKDGTSQGHVGIHLGYNFDLGRSRRR